jgi:hypothetical protein
VPKNKLREQERILKKIYPKEKFEKNIEEERRIATFAKQVRRQI